MNKEQRAHEFAMLTAQTYLNSLNQDSDVREIETILNNGSKNEEDFVSVVEVYDSAFKYFLKHSKTI
ncbi:hypothetical protein [Pediococcus acidilactici]|uniref:hypothetical protein n=1 Tax=Pediococcus acidilactici TaxID=1254 RepID=UPI002F26093D